MLDETNWHQYGAAMPGSAVPAARGRRAAIAPTHAAAQVFREVLTGGPLRRTDLARRTGLSQPSIAKITRALMEAGYLVELGPDAPSGGRTRIGRPATALDVRADREFFVGVKVTADELIGVLTDLRAQVRTSRHEPLEGHRPAEVVAAVRRLVGRLRGARPEFTARSHDLGVCVAGDVDTDRGVARYEPFHGWRDVPLAAMLDRATGLHTVVDNDVRALAEAESWFGAGARVESFLLVTIGSGVTSGLVLDGKVRAGAYGVAGELGHLPVDRQGPKCYCGARGCLEAVASEPAVVRRVAEVTGEPGVTLQRAMDLAHAGHAEVRQVFADAGRAIGLAVGGVVNLVGPQLIVISADHVAGFDLFERHIRAGIAEQAYSAAGRVGIVVQPLPFEEWARGAATVAIARRVTAVSGGPGS
jgi:predicted NBD/HSP70 family sugar kinase